MSSIRTIAALSTFVFLLFGCDTEPQPAPAPEVEQAQYFEAASASDLAIGICFDNCMKGPKVGNESFADKSDRCSEACKPKKESAPTNVLGEAEVMACASALVNPS